MQSFYHHAINSKKEERWLIFWRNFDFFMGLLRTTAFKDTPQTEPTLCWCIVRCGELVGKANATRHIWRLPYGNKNRNQKPINNNITDQEHEHNNIKNIDEAYNFQIFPLCGIDDTSFVEGVIYNYWLR